MTAKRLDHTAIVVRDMDEALARFERVLGISPTLRQVVPEQDVEVAFLPVGATQLELVRPLSDHSGVARYLDRHGESLHHIAFAVPDLAAELGRLAGAGIDLIDQVPRRGVHGQVAFVHPRGTGGVLVELVEDGHSID